MLVRLMALSMAIALLNFPAHAADDAMNVFQDLSKKWEAAFNNAQPDQVAALYSNEALWSSGVFGTLKGRAQIAQAVAAQLKKTPKVTLSPSEAHMSGNVIWGLGSFTFPNGPSGHYGWTSMNDGGSWQIVMSVANVSPPKSQ